MAEQENDRRARRGGIAPPVCIAIALALASCAAADSPAPSTDIDGPGGSGVVTVAPEAGADAVDEETACEVASASPTLTELGMEGYSYDASLVAQLSGCQLNITDPGHEYSSFGVSVITAADVELTANADPTISNTTLVPLPDVGENGHFIGRVAGIDPATDPKSGAIVAGRDSLGVSLSWSMSDSQIPFETFKRAAQELLDALP